MAVDNITLSPQCFGLGVPQEELQGWRPSMTDKEFCQHYSKYHWLYRFTNLSIGPSGKTKFKDLADYSKSWLKIDHQGRLISLIDSNLSPSPLIGCTLSIFQTAPNALGPKSPRSICLIPVKPAGGPLDPPKSIAMTPTARPTPRSWLEILTRPRMTSTFLVMWLESRGGKCPRPRCIRKLSRQALSNIDWSVFFWFETLRRKNKRPTRGLNWRVETGNKLIKGPHQRVSESSRDLGALLIF